MNRPISILIIDDHPMVVRGYQLSLATLTEFNYITQGASNCAEVLEMMEEKKKSFADLLLLDINLPAAKGKGINDGEELGCLVRRQYPKTKIIVHTALNDSHRITNIFHSLKPEGLLIKSEVDETSLLAAVSNVLNGRTYYSSKIKMLLSESNFEDIHIDTWGKKILLYLDKGFKTKDLPEYIPLSIASIERRKRELKTLLGVPSGGNMELLESARQKGFI
ncbi:response regulator [Cytophaga sp. FL35]|uniref:response regulator n=1 Tax=Cytophaga sp. FL35 TaxID=1904456 RepID=UPI001653DA06|nr:response regulator [Cytophaga sp. FL35]MBC6999647.1 response regulator transcription factor [Cytophaga sp. FL35]